MIGSKYTNALSLIPMRSEPSERAEMVNEVLFGEIYQILGEENGSIKILGTFEVIVIMEIIQEINVLML